MNEDRFAGTAKNLGGRVEEGFGRTAGDVKTARQPAPPRMFMGRPRTQPARRMGRLKTPL
jgi:hypothetical protein